MITNDVVSFEQPGPDVFEQRSRVIRSCAKYGIFLLHDPPLLYVRIVQTNSAINDDTSQPNDVFRLLVVQLFLDNRRLDNGNPAFRQCPLHWDMRYIHVHIINTNAACSVGCNCKFMRAFQSDHYHHTRTVVNAKLTMLLR